MLSTVIMRFAPLREVLQLCSYPVVGSPDAPPGVFGLRSIQMASIRAGGHPHGSGMVFALLAFVPRRRGAIDRAWTLGGSRHRLALGPAVRPGGGSAPAQTAQVLGGWHPAGFYARWLGNTVTASRLRN